MADNIKDTAKKIGDAIQKGADNTGIKTASSGVKMGGAAIDFAGDTIKTAGKVLSYPARLVGGTAKNGGGLIKNTAKGLDNVASKGANIATGVLKNPATKSLLMVAAAVFVYKYCKNKLFNNKQKTVNETKAQQLAALEAQNAQMVNDYRSYQFDNSQAQGGHVERHNSQSAGHSHARTH